MANYGDKITVAVLESDNNKKGDLFGRAVKDLFHALGYQDFGLNIAKAGREIDIKGKHRTEKRTLLAECKATKGPIGGSDINKFAGAVEVERTRTKGLQASAYFVSLGGFTASAIEQEEEAGNRLILLDASKIVEELVRGRVIAAPEKAAIVAARSPALASGVTQGQKCALLIHEIGWIWAFFFKTSGKYTHFALVHADGYALHPDLTAEVIASDAESTKLLCNLTHAFILEAESEERTLKEEAKAEYFAYLEREFGGLTLEGLPADQEVGSKTIRLESIYVPLHLTPVPKEGLQISSDKDQGRDEKPSGSSRKTVAEVLSEHRNLAILAAPGGGKTTLLKRLAVAYASADRRGEVADELPSEDWFPLFIRCRQLGDHVRRPITDLIKSLPKYAERSDLIDPFSDAALEALKAGKVLLLVDGLDEISDPGDRSAFAAQLRTFIGTYPAAHVVVTSREAGFRAVSGAMSSACSLYRIADLSTPDIYTLCRAWQHEVVGGSTTAANKIAQSIVNKPRVRDLAINPLLLTTLLLVQRWFGELPPKRSVLYDKAIEVLLMTWNTEGHTPIDQEEAMPQLAYAAFAMMKAKKQSVSAKALKDLFDEARNAMPEVLGYARMSSNELIERVEDRSSLLVQSGHVIEDGQIRPLYEFKHLTFQEYLTAKACVEAWNPERDRTEDYSEVLNEYLTNESWTEVIPLAGVLAGGKGAKRIVDRLTTRLQEFDPGDEPWVDRPKGDVVVLCRNLVQCLVDEVQISPEQVRNAIDCAIQFGEPYRRMVVDLSLSKFSAELPEVAWIGYKKSDAHLLRYANVLAYYSLWHTKDSKNLTATIRELLQSSDPFERVVGLSITMVAFFSMEHGKVFSRVRDVDTDVGAADIDELYSPYVPHERIPAATDGTKIKTLVVESLSSDIDGIMPNVFMSAWAIAWIGEQCTWSDEELELTIRAFVKVWRETSSDEVARIFAWAIWKLPLVTEDSTFSIPREAGLRDFLHAASRQTSHGRRRTRVRDFGRAAKVIGFYAGYKIPYREKLPEPEGSQDAQMKQWLEKVAAMESRSEQSK
ncbi:NACHT domain-containing protein [Streptomyces cyaneofuscatus]|uniref:NACHT domain-containing protein n=1 Tax=Streptomyces cyaneofuscatus TaxID=66883 RepID=UPI00345DA61F